MRHAVLNRVIDNPELNDDFFTNSMYIMFSVHVESYGNRLVLHPTLFHTLMIDKAVSIAYWHIDQQIYNKHVRNVTIVEMPTDAVESFLCRLFPKQLHSDINYNAVKCNWSVQTIAPTARVYKYHDCYAFVEDLGGEDSLSRASIQRRI